jgi:hypothetical protein
MGPKPTLTIGLGLYCFYVGSFLFAYYCPDYKWYGAITGSAIGGVAAGWLWPAQGAFFARSAKLYSRRADIAQAVATGYLASWFQSLI